MGKTTERELISFDWAVKKLLRSKANYDVLEGFLSEKPIIHCPVKIEQILELRCGKRMQPLYARPSS